MLRPSKISLLLLNSILRSESLRAEWRHVPWECLSLPGVPLGKELNAADVKQRRAWFSSGCPASQPVGPRPCVQERGASSLGKTGRWRHFQGGAGSLGFTQAQEVHILPPLVTARVSPWAISVSLGKTSPVATPSWWSVSRNQTCGCGHLLNTTEVSPELCCAALKAMAYNVRLKEKGP